MFRNYLAAAVRNMARNRLYAAISIVGLGVAMAAAVLIGLRVEVEAEDGEGPALERGEPVELCRDLIGTGHAARIRNSHARTMGRSRTTSCARALRR